MAERLSGGNVALALLANTIATGAALVALILTFGSISGAHFNPAVTLADALEGGLTWAEASGYVPVQILGGITGTVAAHLMFSLPAISISHHIRSGPAQFLSEFVASFRSVVRNLGMLTAPFNHRAVRGRRVHNRCVLVHLFNVLRKSGGHDCQIVERHVCRNSPRRRSSIHNRSTLRSAGGNSFLSLAGAGSRPPSQERPSRPRL